MRLLVTGLAQHGKDEVCKILKEKYGYNYTSSSIAAIELFIFDKIGAKWGYKSPMELYDNRNKHRPELYQLITEYNTPDKSKLANDIMETNDIYCGLRCKDELAACRAEGVFEMIVWVDAVERCGVTEGEDSITIRKDMAHYVIDNNGTKEDLLKEIEKMLAFYNEHCRLNLLKATNKEN